MLSSIKVNHKGLFRYNFYFSIMYVKNILVKQGFHCKRHEQNRIKSFIDIICMTINRKHKIHDCDRPKYSCYQVSNHKLMFLVWFEVTIAEL